MLDLEYFKIGLNDLEILAHINYSRRKNMNTCKNVISVPI